MTTAPLARRLGTGDAVVVGLGAMIGAGVFAAFTPAAVAAGSGLLIGLALAAVVAFCNAVASAQLAMTYPTSGGTYVYGRKVLGPWWGFLAGWGFVVGKTASCAAMALTFAAYAIPDGGRWQRVVAALAVAVLTAATLRGITRTAAAARILLTVTAVVLIGFLVVTVRGPAGGVPASLAAHGGVHGVLQAAGLLFFAFAGYARIATLAEEVRRTEDIGRAILIALGIAVATYLAVGVTLIRVLGEALPSAATPLAEAVARVGADWAQPWVRVGAAAASLGSLLALLAGVSRTTLAMARERDLPGALAEVEPHRQVPARAQLLIGAIIIALVLLLDLRHAIGFSSCGVLLYYAVANAAAWRQPADERRWPRALQVLGLAGCLTLIVSLPLASVLIGIAVLGAGCAGRALLRG